MLYTKEQRETFRLLFPKAVFLPGDRVALYDDMYVVTQGITFHKEISYTISDEIARSFTGSSEHIVKLHLENGTLVDWWLSEHYLKLDHPKNLVIVEGEFVGYKQIKHSRGV